jgi:hypothetical protein
MHLVEYKMNIYIYVYSDVIAQMVNTGAAKRDQYGRLPDT